MTRHAGHDALQLGFGALLADAEKANLRRQQEQECAHLPGNVDAALPFYRTLIERHHAAMLAGNLEAVMQLREEAYRLATKLNGYDAGILADEDAPGCVLDCMTRSTDGRVPLWGQAGAFEIACQGMHVQIEMHGIFGIGAMHLPWIGFAAHAVDLDKPFLSETGYRSFSAIGGELHPGFTPDSFAAEVIAAHVRRALKGRLVAIRPEYRRIVP